MNQVALDAAHTWLRSLTGIHAGPVAAHALTLLGHIDALRHDTQQMQAERDAARVALARQRRLTTATRDAVDHALRELDGGPGDQLAAALDELHHTIRQEAARCP